MTKIPLGKIAGSAAIIKDKKILLLKRLDSAAIYPNCWTFPSGGVEEIDVSLRATVIREVKEGTDLDFVPKQKFGFYESITNNKRYIALVYTGEWSGTVKSQPEEIAEYRFFSFDDAMVLNLAFAYRGVLQDLYKEGLIQ